MTKLKSAAALGVALMLFAGCHSVATPQADGPDLIEPDLSACSERAPECRVTDQPVAEKGAPLGPDIDLETNPQSETETAREPIQGIISLDDLKAHDQDADTGQQDGDQSDSNPGDTPDSADSAPDPDAAICYYDHEDQPVYRGQVEASCAVHFPDDPDAAGTCVSDHCD